MSLVLNSIPKIYKTNTDITIKDYKRLLFIKYFHKVDYMLLQL